MIIKAKSYFATAFFMNSREIVGLPLSLVIVGLVFYVMLGFNPGIQKHKALAHDMHAESNALQQRSAPQPVLRSSWLQLARFNKDSYRCRCCGQAGYSLRASTKIRTAAGVAVKLATACKTTKKTRCFFTKAAAFSRLTKFIRLSDRSEPEFDASVHSRAVVRG